MRSFLKYTLAAIIGVLVANVILLFVFFGIIGAVATLSDKPIEVKENSILRIKFEGEILDRVSDNPFDYIRMFSFNMDKKPLGLNKILESIKRAGEDSRIKGIYLDLTDIRGNFGALATAAEIRNALTIFKSSGKFIYSYSNLGYSQKGYYLASVADKVYTNPEAPLVLTGMSSSVSFYKETLRKLGIEPEVVKVGKFKAAVEPFVADEMSDANREQIQRYLNSLWTTTIKGIAADRNLTVDTINAITDKFDIYTAKEFKEYGFFDDVIFEDEMLALLREKCGIDQAAKLNFVSIADYQKVPLTGEKAFSKDKIAVIYAQGEIGIEQAANSIGPELAASIRKARENKNVKAIVLRVNSPGGSALVSDIIWREVDLAAKEKPLIASMGNVAASGGYYISCAADTIVADPATLTGSIGIFGMFFSGEKLIQDKIGIHTDVVKTNKYSDFGGSYPLGIPISSRPMTVYEKSVLQKYVDQGYETFLSRVTAGRGIGRDQLDAIAQGRVWTGEDALKIGLVDLLGGLEDAIRIAAQKAGLEQYSLVEYPVQKNPFEEFLSGFTKGVKSRILKNELGPLYDHWNSISNMIHTEGLVARIPYEMVLN